MVELPDDVCCSTCPSTLAPELDPHDKSHEPVESNQHSSCSSFCEVQTQCPRCSLGDTHSSHRTVRYLLLMLQSCYKQTPHMLTALANYFGHSCRRLEHKPPGPDSSAPSGHQSVAGMQ